MSAESPPTVAVYGATGRVGRRVIAHLRTRAVAVVAGGRDRAGLAGLAPLVTRVAALDDTAALVSLLAGCRGVVNCAPVAAGGGASLIAAAIEAGVHYVDAAGEQAYLHDVHERFSDAARARGVAVVPGAGFDYALGDCLAWLTARPAGAADEMTIAYALSGARVAANSVAFAADTPAREERVYRNGRWQPPGLDIVRARFTFPPPVGSQPVARYGSGEVITVPRHTAVRTLTTLITTRSLVPHAALVPIFPYVRPIVAWVRRTPLRRALRGVLALVPRRATPPDDGETDRGRYTLVVETRGAGPARRGIIDGEGFEETTARVLAYVAGRLAAAGPSGAVGVVAPSEACDAEGLLDDLAAGGARWRIEPAPGGPSSAGGGQP